MYFTWPYWQQFTLWGNSGADYISAGLWFVGTLLIAKLLQLLFLNRLRRLAEKTKTDFDDVVINIFSSLRPPFYLLLAIYFASKSLSLPPLAGRIVTVVFVLVLVYEIIRAVERVIDYLFKRFARQQASSDTELQGLQKQGTLRLFKIIIRIVLWTVGLLLALSNIGINVTSLVASLGIGGIAVALALQNILGDLFSSFTLYLDKPFQVGDFIMVGEHMGTVEKIGLKTTRIRSLSGEQLVMSNQELTSTRIQNYGRMQQRRVVFQIGVVYGTSHEQLQQIPQIIKEVITAQGDADFDRCHFFEYGDFSLNFETVFFVNTADYNTYMDIRQRVNLDIYRRFAEQGIEFAYPTQTVIVNKG